MKKPVPTGGGDAAEAASGRGNVRFLVHTCTYVTLATLSSYFVVVLHIRKVEACTYISIFILGLFVSCIPLL